MNLLEFHAFWVPEVTVALSPADSIDRIISPLLLITT